MCSRLGLFLNVFEQLVSLVPNELYQYLSTHSDYLLNSFATNFQKVSIINIFRYLLDTPITSSLSDGSTLEGPWWHDSDHLLSLLLDSLQSPDRAHYIELLFWTILTRGLPIELASLSLRSSPEPSNSTRAIFSFSRCSPPRFSSRCFASPSPLPARTSPVRPSACSPGYSGTPWMNVFLSVKTDDF